jgi:hypothetical protein
VARLKQDKTMQANSHNNQELPKSDLGAAVFFLAWAGVGWLSIATSSDLFSGRSSGLDPGPALLPIIVLIILTGGGISLAVRALLIFGSSARHSGSRDKFRWLPIYFLASVVAFPVFLNAIGYIWATVIFVFCWSFLLTPMALHRPLHTTFIASIAAIFMAALIYLGFDLVIGARLP